MGESPGYLHSLCEGQKPGSRPVCEWVTCSLVGLSSSLLKDLMSLKTKQTLGCFLSLQVAVAGSGGNQEAWSRGPVLSVVTETQGDRPTTKTELTLPSVSRRSFPSEKIITK
jgi:hypothetical protein